MAAAALVLGVCDARSAPTLDATAGPEADAADGRRSTMAVARPVNDPARAVESLLEIQDRRPGLRFTERRAAPPEPPPRTGTAPSGGSSESAGAARAVAGPAVPVGPAGLFGSGLNADATRQQSVRAPEPGATPVRALAVDAPPRMLAAAPDGHWFGLLRLTALVDAIRFLRENRTEVMGLALATLAVVAGVALKRRRAR